MNRIAGLLFWIKHRRLGVGQPRPFDLSPHSLLAAHCESFSRTVTDRGLSTETVAGTSGGDDDYWMD
jgi:hypothetical protein